jgi:hypothetical protein
MHTVDVDIIQIWESVRAKFSREYPGSLKVAEKIQDDT